MQFSSSVAIFDAHAYMQLPYQYGYSYKGMLSKYIPLAHVHDVCNRV